MIDPRLVILLVGVVRRMWEQLDDSCEKLASHGQVDNDPQEFHRVSDCAGCDKVLDAMANINHQATASVLSCAAAITVT